MNKDSWKLRVC